MKGDFSRGHAPDHARSLPADVDPTGERRRAFHRVLMQQGRLLLDSDFNAAVDALATTTRRGVRALGCDAGSPDLGFLVTPGRLLGVWRTSEGAEIVSGAPALYLDHRYKYLGRYPGFYIGTVAEEDESSPTGSPPATAAATVRLPLRQAFDASVSSRIAVWVRVDATTPVTFKVNGVSTSVTGPTADYTRVQLNFSALADTTTMIEISVDADTELWIGLIEQDQDADDPPFFWAAEGTFHLDGLIVENAEDGRFPELSFPDWAGFWGVTSPESGAPVDGLVFDSLPVNTPLVAYLEVWEQHLTFIHDPGLLEQALGGETDTTTRSRLVGQIKIARANVTGDVAAMVGQVRALFAAAQDSGARLTVVDADDAPDATDPCDLPETTGYSGSDNRLYRFEVHQGGPLEDTLLKWSRDNGSELFEATLDSSNNLVFSSETDLSEGDLVEVLSDVTELGDDAMATVGPAAFNPSGRSVGQLAALKAVETVGATDEVLFSLVDPDDSQLAISLDGRYGALSAGSTLRVRRWHGTLSPLDEDGAAGGAYAIEDGVEITLSTTGTYLPGQYWQYQARVNAENANGPWRAAPHGPERLFTPLALLGFQGKPKPLELLAWLDSRFPSLCGITAEDVAFDGERVGSDATTVQEALEELFDQGPEIIEAGCGEIVITPTTDIQAAVDLIPPGGDARLCFQPGTWNLTGTVVAANKGNLMLAGAGAGTKILAPDIERAFHFQDCDSVVITDLSVGVETTYADDGLQGVITFEGVTNVELTRLNIKCGSGYKRRASGVLVRAKDTIGVGAIDKPAPRVRIVDCRVDVGHMQTGILLNDIAYATVEGCRVIGPEGTFSFTSYANEPGLHAAIGNVFLNRVVIGDDMAMTDPYPGRARTYIDDPSGWGDVIVTFDTDPSLYVTGGSVSSFWEGVLASNPIEGLSTATDEWRAHSLRKLGRRIARFLLGVPDPTYSIRLDAAQRAAFQAVLDRLIVENAPLAGSQGIVVGTRNTPNLGDGLGGDARRVGSPRAPEVHILNNRIEGFVQGIHLGASHNKSRKSARYRLYKAHVKGNTVLLRVPGFAGERHGIFVGNVHSAAVRDNTVELLFPEYDDWEGMKPIDGVRVWGPVGPMVAITGNHCQGVSLGVRFHPLNFADSVLTGISWTVAGNAYFGAGTPEVVP